MSMHDYIEKNWKITRVSGAPPDGAKQGDIFRFEQKGATNDIDPTKSPSAPDWSKAKFLTYENGHDMIRGELEIKAQTYKIHLKRGKWSEWSPPHRRRKPVEGLICYYHEKTSSMFRRPFRWLLPTRFVPKLLKVNALLRSLIFSHSGVWHAPD